MKEIALIIVNYNTYELSIECVNSILQNCTCDYHIYLIDNHSTNDSYAILKERFIDNVNISVAQSPINNGYSSGLNYGLKIAGTDTYRYYAFLNNDLIFNKGVIEKLICTFECADNIGIVGGEIVDAKGNRQNSYKYLLTFSSHFMGMKPMCYFTKSAEIIDDYNFENVLVFDGMVAGCCFLISEEVMKRIGKFDDNIFIYYEEDALGRILYNIGLKAALNPKAEIVHMGSQTIKRSAFTYYQRYRSALYVLWKYCEVTKWQLQIIYLIYLCSFLVKRGKDYTKYRIKLKKFYRELIR